MIANWMGMAPMTGRAVITCDVNGSGNCNRLCGDGAWDDNQNGCVYTCDGSVTSSWACGDCESDGQHTQDWACHHTCGAGVGEDGSCCRKLRR